MTTPDDWTPVEPPLAGDEAAALLGALERLRAYVAWKCGGLDAAALQVRVAASAITLGGLLKHLAAVEGTHFARLLLATDPPPPWDTVDWDADPEWEWRTAADDAPQELFAQWQASVQRSRVIVDKALASGDMSQSGKHVTAQGESPNLRRIVLDMIEEYARHLGHADLIREAIDGRVGEDPAP